MNWLHSQFTSEQYRDDLRAAEQEAKVQALLAEAQTAQEAHSLRNALGEKLVELGERLQDPPKTAQALNAAKG